MGKDLNFYKELSEQLEKEIEIYEGSYQGFEKAIDTEFISKDASRDWTDEQRKVAVEFVNFYKEEGLYERGLTTDSYKKIKSAIIERVNFFKEQKAVADKMVSLHEELNKLKNNGELSEAELNRIKEKAADRYDEGTSKYNAYLEKLKNNYIANRKVQLKEELENTKTKEKELKKENGIDKLSRSLFGPTGNKIRNSIAWLHNKNVDLRKNRVLNLIVKLGMVLGYTALVASLGLTGLPLIVAGGVSIVSAFNTLKHTFQKVPEKWEIKENPGKLKENWFKFLKSRNWKSIATSKKLYQGIDFSKYEKKEATPSEEPVADTLEPAKEAEKVESVTPVEEEIKVEPVAPTKEETRVETAAPAKEETKVEPVAPAKEESRIETAAPVKDETEKKVSKTTKTPEVLPTTDSGIKVESMADVVMVLNKFKEQGGLQRVDDWYTLKNIRLYLGEVISKTGDTKYIELRNMFDDMAKTMPEELRARIGMIKTFENINVDNKRKKMTTNVKEATAKYREQEFSRIKELIINAPLEENIMNEVNYFFNHYTISNSDHRDLMELLEKRENAINADKGRGGK